MTAPQADRGAFDFDPELVDRADELAEAFILEEFDAALLQCLDQEYLELLAKQSPEEVHIDVDPVVLEAAMQVAALVADRLAAAETRTSGRPSRIPYTR